MNWWIIAGIVALVLLYIFAFSLMAMASAADRLSELHHDEDHD